MGNSHGTFSPHQAHDDTVLNVALQLQDARTLARLQCVSKHWGKRVLGGNPVYKDHLKKLFLQQVAEPSNWEWRPVFEDGKPSKLAASLLALPPRFFLKPCPAMVVRLRTSPIIPDIPATTWLRDDPGATCDVFKAIDSCIGQDHPHQVLDICVFKHKWAHVDAATPVEGLLASRIRCNACHREYFVKTDKHALCTGPNNDHLNKVAAVFTEQQVYHSVSAIIANELFSTAQKQIELLQQQLASERQRNAAL